jgi:hypothetical protein
MEIRLQEPVLLVGIFRINRRDHSCIPRVPVLESRAIGIGQGDVKYRNHKTQNRRRFKRRHSERGDRNTRQIWGHKCAVDALVGGHECSRRLKFTQGYPGLTKTQQQCAE